MELFVVEKSPPDGFVEKYPLHPIVLVKKCAPPL